MDHPAPPRSHRRHLIFGIMALVWSAVGLAVLGRPAEPRAPAGLPRIPARDGSPAPTQVGTVTTHDPGRASAGLNLVTDGDSGVVRLLDMDGAEIHRWHRDLADLVDGGTERRTGTWQRARLLPDGELRVIVGGVGLVALDRDSAVLWKAAAGAHDDFEVLPDGRTVVLSRRPRARQDLSRARIVVEDVLTVVNADGTEAGTVSVVDALLAWPDPGWRVEPLSGDVLQTGVVAQVGAGLVLAVRRPGMLVGYDPVGRRVTEAATGPWFRVSHVDPLPDGGLLVLDTAPNALRSRVLELAPGTREIRWTWEGAPLDDPNGGTVQRLANGNTLVTAGDDGATVEVAPDGAIVWALGPSAPSPAPTTPYETERLPLSAWEAR